MLFTKEGGHHRVLRAFRSHKNLKQQIHIQHPHFRERRPSDSSTHSRTSDDSSRPSTSTSRTDVTDVSGRSLEWDPLKLNPPMVVCNVRTRAAGHQSLDGRGHHVLREARSSHNMRARASYRGHQASSMASHENYDEFDFGFNRAAEQQQDLFLDHVTDRDQQPTMACEWGYAVTPRPRKTGLSEADMFMKRGNWKRRGIVFETTMPLASEEESFAIW